MTDHQLIAIFSAQTAGGSRLQAHHASNANIEALRSDLLAHAAILERTREVLKPVRSTTGEGWLDMFIPRDIVEALADVRSNPCAEHLEKVENLLPSLRKLDGERGNGIYLSGGVYHVLIPSGWRVRHMPESYEIQLRARSSTAMKTTGLVMANGIGVIDSDFRGEIMTSWLFPARSNPVAPTATWKSAPAYQLAECLDGVIGRPLSAPPHSRLSAMALVPSSRTTVLPGDGLQGLLWETIEGKETDRAIGGFGSTGA